MLLPLQKEDIISSKMQKERDTFKNYCVFREGASSLPACLRAGTSFFVAVTVSEFITEAGGTAAVLSFSSFSRSPKGAFLFILDRNT